MQLQAYGTIISFAITHPRRKQILNIKPNGIIVVYNAFKLNMLKHTINRKSSDVLVKWFVV